MKAVLISIQPKWCELIESGKKTIEVRKTRPKLDTPFKCYIYCTYGNISENYCLGKRGKVIGEFVCDRIEDITYNEVLVDGTLYKSYYYLRHGSKSLKKTCLTIQEIKNYLNGKYGFGWHVSDLKIYDKPKELSEFVKQCPEYFSSYEEGCCAEMCVFYEEGWCKGFCLPITRPPQSWCYVEVEK